MFRDVDYSSLFSCCSFLRPLYEQQRRYTAVKISKTTKLRMPATFCFSGNSMVESMSRRGKLYLRSNSSASTQMTPTILLLQVALLMLLLVLQTRTIKFVTAASRSSTRSSEDCLIGLEYTTTPLLQHSSLE